MNQSQKKELEYLHTCVKNNTEKLVNQKPSAEQLVSFVKSKGMSLLMGNTSSQNIVDMCTALITYKVLQSK